VENFHKGDDNMYRLLQKYQREQKKGGEKINNYLVTIFKCFLSVMQIMISLLISIPSIIFRPIDFVYFFRKFNQCTHQFDLKHFKFAFGS
jgi:hypothetical protein